MYASTCASSLKVVIILMTEINVQYVKERLSILFNTQKTSICNSFELNKTLFSIFNSNLQNKSSI